VIDPLPPDDIDELLDPLPPTLTREEIAALLRITVRTLTEWCERGRFPRPLRLTGHVHRWPKASLRRWLLNTARKAVPA
jgi:predicted DNA-binding transcriptional regulator AlpA